MRLDGMIFDLDGTLGDTLPVCFAAFRTTFQSCLGRDYFDREIRAMFGPSEEGIFERLMPGNAEGCAEGLLELVVPERPDSMAKGFGHAHNS